MRALLDVATRDRLSALWRFVSASGARRGEVLALRWRAVDLTARTVRIERSRTIGIGGEIVEGPPKTTRGRRAVDIDEETAAILREHRKSQLRQLEGSEDGGYVFTMEDGRPLSPYHVSDAFDALCRRAGVAALGLHALRHMHGSVLLRRGVPLHVVSRRLGHSSEAFTAKVYAHVLPGHGAEAAAVFAAAIEARV